MCVMKYNSYLLVGSLYPSSGIWFCPHSYRSTSDSCTFLRKPLSNPCWCRSGFESWNRLPRMGADRSIPGCHGSWSCVDKWLEGKTCRCRPPCSKPLTQTQVWLSRKLARQLPCNRSITTFQYVKNAKLSKHRFWHCHENVLIKTIQTIPHNL